MSHQKVNSLLCGSGHFFPSISAGHSSPVGAGRYSSNTRSGGVGSSSHPPCARRDVWWLFRAGRRWPAHEHRFPGVRRRNWCQSVDSQHGEFADCVSPRRQGSRRSHRRGNGRQKPWRHTTHNRWDASWVSKSIVHNLAETGLRYCRVVCIWCLNFTSNREVTCVFIYTTKLMNILHWIDIGSPTF